MPVTISDPLLTETEAAEIIGVKPQTLAIWRCSKRYALPYFKIGGRFIRYRRSAVERFIDANTVGAETVRA